MTQKRILRSFQFATIDRYSSYWLGMRWDTLLSFFSIFLLYVSSKEKLDFSLTTVALSVDVGRFTGTNTSLTHGLFIQAMLIQTAALTCPAL